jgi:hypothetical protein
VHLVRNFACIAFRHRPQVFTQVPHFPRSHRTNFFCTPVQPTQPRASALRLPSKYAVPNGARKLYSRPNCGNAEVRKCPNSATHNRFTEFACLAPHRKAINLVKPFMFPASCKFLLHFQLGMVCQKLTEEGAKLPRRAGYCTS